MLTRAARHFQSLRRTAPSNGGALLQADVRHLPLPDGSVDVVLCDLPFGRQFGTLEETLGRTRWHTVRPRGWLCVAPRMCVCVCACFAHGVGRLGGRSRIVRKRFFFGL